MEDHYNKIIHSCPTSDVSFSELWGHTLGVDLGTQEMGSKRPKISLLVKGSYRYFSPKDI